MVSAFDGNIAIDHRAIRQVRPVSSGFQCDTCARSFESKIGLGVHRRRAHPTVCSNESTSRVESNHRRWSDDERRVLAESELEVKGRTDIKNLNAYLAGRHLGRSVEAIKGQRKQIAYKAVLAEVESERSQSTRFEDIEPSLDGASLSGNEEQLENSDELENALRREILSVMRLLVRRRGDPESIRLNKQFYAAALHFIASEYTSMEKVMEWLDECLARKSGGGPSKNGQRRSRCNKRAGKRKHAYSYAQTLYRRSKRRLLERILKPIQDTSNMPNASDMFAFWSKIYGRAPNQQVENSEPSVPTDPESYRIWSVITSSDIKTSELVNKTAPGPDEVSARQWRKISPDLRRGFYMMLMLSKDRSAVDMYSARTVFIPKGDKPDTPASFRPIGITSVITRQFHRILARRMGSYRSFNAKQKAFRSVDGVAEGLTLLQTVVDDAWQRRNELHVVSIDITKAYDNVTHSDVIRKLRSFGCVKQFADYLQNVYNQTATYLQYNGNSMKVPVEVGVIQGDPISPIAFNYLMDEPIETLDDKLGYCLNGEPVSCIAFADDIMLMAKSRVGMTHNLNKFVGKLADLGLKVNIDKSYALSIIPDGKRKSVFVATDANFQIDDRCLKQMGPEDKWTYLGVTFQGTKAINEVTLVQDMEKIGKAPLKPQQKLMLLNSHLIPKYQHQMVLGCVSVACLEAMDRAVRSTVRKWLHLPNSAPTAYIHAKASLGGLSIPRFAIDIPRLRIARLTRIVGEGGDRVSIAMSRAAYYTKRVLEATEQLCKVSSIFEESEKVSKEDKNRYWLNELEQYVDTKDLVDSVHNKSSSSFVYGCSHLMSGHDYVHAHQIRVGCIPTRARRGRGLTVEKKCRGCDSPSETNYHVLQACPMSKGSRTKRHDVVLDILEAELVYKRQQGVFREPNLDTAVGLRKPDLIITNGLIAMVIDLHIVGGEKMADARKAKIEKYKDIGDYIRTLYGCSDVVFEAVTVSYKGIIERDSLRLLKSLNVSNECIRLVSMAVLYGSWMVWYQFKNSARQ